jgi:hypothetical protein
MGESLLWTSTKTEAGGGAEGLTEEDTELTTWGATGVLGVGGSPILGIDCLLKIWLYKTVPLLQR